MKITIKPRAAGYWFSVTTVNNGTLEGFEPSRDKLAAAIAQIVATYGIGDLGA